MAKKRNTTGKRRADAAKPERERVAAVAAVAPPRGTVVVAVVAILTIVLAATSLAVDTAASEAFDAPKRAAALLGSALAAAVALFVSGDDALMERWRRMSRLQRAALALGAAAFLGALLAALASPRRPVSLSAMRSVTLLAMLLPLGASRAVARGRGWLAGSFLAACAINAAVSILQGLDLFHPFALQTTGSRQETGAFAGNVGYLAIALALASVAALGLLLAARSLIVRILCGVALALFAADLLVNRNLTALTAALAGVAALFLARFRKRAALPLLGAFLAAGLLVAAYPPLRHRAVAVLQVARTGDWDALVSYRGGPWAAAAEMARERPLLGFGPGTFGAEYVPHRLSAEIRAKRRFVSPLLSSSYGEAHNDYLQAASDAGIPVAFLALGAAGCLLAAIARAAWKRGDPETALLFALLVAGAVAALTWFPLQRPITAVPLLLVAGRAWKLAGDAAIERGCCVKTGLSIAAAVVLAGLAAPELPRYSADRRVGRATAAFQESLDAPRGAETSRRILAAGELALAATSALPGDPRPWMVAAASNLLTGQAERALEFYREAFATGERSEIDLNLGRAYAGLARQDAAGAAFLRAGWISPELLAALPETQRAPLLEQIARLSAALAQGRLEAPPPLPEGERR